MLTPKTPIDVTLNRTRMKTEISNMKKRNGKAFIRSYRMNLPRTAEFIPSANWDEVAWPNEDGEGGNDYHEKSLAYCLEE